jgi:hypothetical protein
VQDYQKKEKEFIACMGGVLKLCSYSNHTENADIPYQITISIKEIPDLHRQDMPLCKNNGRPWLADSSGMTFW